MSPARDAPSLHEQVVDAIGADVIDGRLAPGDRLTLDDLQTRFGVSRTVARDAIHTLESLGLVAAKRRVGITILGGEEWRVFSPRVIRWRLSGTDREAQFRDVTELRVAIEPIAAARTARRTTTEVRERLVALASELRRLGEAGDLDTFLEVDIEFHRLILQASGNLQFAAMSEVVAIALTERTRQHRMPFQPRPEALREHERVAAAIAAGDADEARRAAQALVDEVARAFEAPDGDASGPCCHVPDVPPRRLPRTANPTPRA